MIVGRDSEIELIRAVVSRAFAGAGGAMVVSGPAGIGKTSLVREALAPHAEVVWLSGTEAERDIPYAAVATVVSPIRTYLRELPDPQRDAIRTTLGLQVGAPPGRLLAGLALLGLLSAASTHNPLLIVVDDLQWVDPPSRDAMVFVARRLQADPVAFIFTVRNETPGSESHGLSRIDLAGLSDDDAALLLPALHPRVVARLAQDTGGNPLAMLETAQTLTVQEASGGQALPNLLATTSPERVYEAVLAALTDDARAAARVAALLPSHAPRQVLTTALGMARLNLEHLAPVETSGLLRRPDRVEWKHPLARSAATRGTSSEIVDAHRALAAAWQEVAPSNPAGAWHLSETVTGTDTDASDAMFAVAQLAERRDASADAADAYERAARLCPDVDRRSMVLGLAATAATRAGLSQRAADLLDQALDHQTDPEVEAGLRNGRGRLETFLGHPDRAFELHMRAIELSTQPGLQVWAAVEALTAATLGGRPDRAQHAADLAAELHQPSDPEQVFLSLYARGAAAGLNRELQTCRRLMDSAWSLIEREDLLDKNPSLVVFALAMESHDLAGRPTPLRPAEVSAVERLKLSGDLTFLAWATRLSATRQDATGETTGVYAAYEESELLSRLSGQPTRLIESLLALAEADALRGETQLCMLRLREGRALAAAHGMPWHLGWADFVEAELHLGSGNHRGAVPMLRRALELDSQRAWALPELLEAIRTTESLTAAIAEMALHSPMGEPWNELAEAMVDPDDRSAANTMIVCLGKLHHAFDKGRYMLAVGERLRRAGDRKSARIHLREAVELLRDVPAEPWVARAEAELRASGATLRREAHGERLTPSEVRVASLVAEGRTNKDVAALLFLSPKTVDFHLGRAYRKLGVSNRTALSNAMQPPSAPPTN